MSSADLRPGDRFLFTIGADLDVYMREYADIEVRGVVDGMIVYRQRALRTKDPWVYRVEPRAWFEVMMRDGRTLRRRTGGASRVLDSSQTATDPKGDT